MKERANKYKVLCIILSLILITIAVLNITGNKIGNSPMTFIKQGFAVIALSADAIRDEIEETIQLHQYKIGMMNKTMDQVVAKYGKPDARVNDHHVGYCLIEGFGTSLGSAGRWIHVYTNSENVVSKVEIQPCWVGG